MSTYVNLGKGDGQYSRPFLRCPFNVHLMLLRLILSEMLSVMVQIENIIAQAVAPGADLNSLLQQAQNLVNNS